MESEPPHYVEIAGVCFFIVVVSLLAYQSHVYENQVKDIPTARGTIREMIHGDDLMAANEFLSIRIQYRSYSGQKAICTSAFSIFICLVPILIISSIML
ncbi:MAG: hypothetical protein HXS44_17830 [Theionarchaea archaeon]|nr:hypothetical protein [Theionarchaea archaeon]